MANIDKGKAWNRVMRALAEEVDFGTLAVVQDNGYLDSLEGNVALVGCKSFTLMEVFQRKRVREKLEPIFSELCNQPIQVKLVNGRPRIIEKPQQPVYQALQPMDGIDKDERALASLHAQYGDIMGIVDKHPVFVQAQRPIENGGWGIFNKAMTRYCKDYGVLTVLTGLRTVARMAHVERPRAYFVNELKRGRWGQKLTVTPSATGPQLQEVRKEASS